LQVVVFITMQVFAFEAAQLVTHTLQIRARGTLVR
jgi:hypothetical protein